MKNEALRRTWTLEDFIEDALQFGVSLEAAEIVAPSLVRLLNDPRGFAVALAEDEPQLAEKVGIVRLQ